MTLLEIIQTIPPDKARLIDEILAYYSYSADRLGFGDGRADRDGPSGWDRNKLLAASFDDLIELKARLLVIGHGKSSYYSDFTGR